MCVALLCAPANVGLRFVLHGALAGQGAMPHLVDNRGKVRDWEKYQHLWMDLCPPQVTSSARGFLGPSLMSADGELRKDSNRMQKSGGWYSGIAELNPGDATQS